MSVFTSSYRKANINVRYTSVDTFTLDKVFGLVDNPGCKITLNTLEAFGGDLDE